MGVDRKMTDTLNILYTCDENYAPYAGISMYSLFENNKDIDRIRVYLVESGVSDKNKERLVRQAEAFGRELILVDSSDISEQIKKLNIPAYRGSYSANFRLFFHTFITPDTKRLLYIDCDTLIVGSLAPLLTLDMNGCAAGVVRDSLSTEYKTMIGFDESEDYFNSGVTLIDVKAWIESGITEKLLDHVQNVRSRYCNPDQDLLNIALRDCKYILPPKYNFQPSHRAFSHKAYFSAYKHTKYYSEEELDSALAEPVILHTYRFLGDFPWHKGNLHPDNRLFDEYMKRSLWSDYEKRPAGRGIIFTLEKLLYRILPKSVFLRLFAAITLRSFKKQNEKILSEMNRK